MTDSNQPSLTQHPVFWIIAGGGIALVLVTIFALLLVPTFVSSRINDQFPAASFSAPALLAASTAIPTFTPSPTLSPTTTPTDTPTATPSQTPSPTPTETPTTTPTITSTPQPVVIANKDTQLFLGPGTDYSEQGWLAKGKSGLIISQLMDGDWWYVENEYGIRGWAEANKVTVENDTSQVPIVTPLPWIPSMASKPAATAASESIIEPLELVEIWPVYIDCSGGFEMNLWIKASGGTGTYTYLINNQIVAENVIGAGFTARVYTPSGAWVGAISVISGDLRAEKTMYFSPADWCD